MTFQYIQLVHVDQIATLTLNRTEKRNALNAAFIQEISQALAQLLDQVTVRVLIIKANGESFCAGADIAWMQKMATASQTENEEDAQLLADLLYQLYTFPKPVIVLAQGAIRGGGLGLLAVADIAIAAENATFAFSEVKIGVTPSMISPYVIAAIGARAAHYYFLTGERFGAKEAHRIGLVHQVTSSEALISTGLSIADVLLQNSPAAVASAKKLIHSVINEKINEDLAQKTAEHLANMRASYDAKEGLQAFLEKRIPHWT
jgi:methylglutaconyl-CoA hydratase